MFRRFSANAFILDHAVFHVTVLQRTNPFPNKPWFLTCLQYKSFENTVGKGEIASNKQRCPKKFSFFFGRVENTKGQITRGPWWPFITPLADT